MTHHKPLDVDHHQKLTDSESNSTEKFKELFIHRMKEYKEDIASRVSQKGFEPGWRDKLALGGVSVVSVAGASVIAILATASMVTAAATGGASLAIAIVAIVAAEGYNIYRAQQKKKQYRRAVDFLNHDDIDKKIDKIADILADIYKIQLENCTEEHAIKLANACFKPIKHEIQTNKHLKFHELLNAGQLQALLIKSLAHAPKEKINLDGENHDDCNTRSALFRAAIYCEENGRFYVSAQSKPEKYGSLNFKTRREVEDFKILVSKYKKDDEKWDFHRMAPATVKKYYKSGLFVHPKNDAEFHDDHKETKSDDSSLDDSHTLVHSKAS